MKLCLGLETVEDYPPKDIPRATVGVSKDSIDKIIKFVRDFQKSVFTYYKVFDKNDIPSEDNGKFYYDIHFINKYTYRMSNSFEIWIPSEEAPLLINHINQDLRILIGPIKGSG